MHINCPYCETPYDIDDLLLPDGNIKVRCKVCSNIFILNKNAGAAKNEPAVSALNNELPHAGESSFIDKPAVQEPVSNDFMQSIMAEINSAAVGNAGKHGNNADAALQKDSVSARKGKTTALQLITLIILIVLFLIAAASALIHYNIINIPFLPQNLLSFFKADLI